MVKTPHLPKQISERAKRLVAPREKFMVLEVMPKGVNVLFLSVDEDRKIILEKFIKDADLQKFLKSPFRRLSQKSWEGEYFFRSHRKVIVAAGSSLATTMPIPLDLSRDRKDWKEEITLTELENVIAQAMARIFTQCRSEAAKRLGIDDLHTILVGAKADQFRVDGHVVVNPIGFIGRKIVLLLELTFTSREIFENFKTFFNSPDDFFFIESPQAWFLSVARARELPLNRVVEGEDGANAELFVFEKANGEHPILYREKIEWSFRKIFEMIAMTLGVGIPVAQELYRDYRAGKLSPSAERGFRKIIEPAVEELIDKMERAKVHGSVYLDTAYPAPFDIPHKAKGIVFEGIPTEEVLAELDLIADPTSWTGNGGDAEDSPHYLFRSLSPFFEAYFAKSTSEINQKLRRRLHWLA